MHSFIYVPYIIILELLLCLVVLFYFIYYLFIFLLCFPTIFLFHGFLTAPWGSSDRSLKTPVLKYKINSLHQLSVSAFPSISPSLEMAGRKWSSLLHTGSHYLLLEVHVIANAHHMDGILVWAPQNPLTITLTSHWGPSISSMKRKRKKKCVTVLVRRLLEKRQRTGTWLCVLADVIFFWQASVPHICIYFLIYFCHVGAALLERRLVKKHWAEAADPRRRTAWLLSR